jgi:hypothetical protein
MADQIVQRALIFRADDGTHELRDLRAPEVLGPGNFDVVADSEKNAALSLSLLEPGRSCAERMGEIPG